LKSHFGILTPPPSPLLQISPLRVSVRAAATFLLAQYIIHFLQPFLLFVIQQKQWSINKQIFFKWATVRFHQHYLFCHDVNSFRLNIFASIKMLCFYEVWKCSLMIRTSLSVLSLPAMIFSVMLVHYILLLMTLSVINDFTLKCYEQ